MEKKEKAIAARAASAPWLRGSSSGVVRLHWLAKKQKLTNHMNVQKPATKNKKEEPSSGQHWKKYTSTVATTTMTSTEQHSNPSVSASQAAIVCSDSYSRHGQDNERHHSLWCPCVAATLFLGKRLTFLLWQCTTLFKSGILWPFSQHLQSFDFMLHSLNSMKIVYVY